MISQRMNRLTRTIRIGAIFLVTLFLAPSPTYALSYSDGSTGPECPLHDTPLERCGAYSWYKAEDKVLNARYKILSKAYGKNTLANLKKVQREWIKWRDAKCNEVQAKSGCDNGLCEGVAHDECIIHLTEARSLELLDFIKNPGDAEKRLFQFSKKNRYLDYDR